LVVCRRRSGGGSFLGGVHAVRAPGHHVSQPSKHSARLLDILKEEKVPATFFLLGKRHIEKYPELVERMADEGHEVADHTWDHERLTELEADEIREEIERPDKEIERITGRRPTLMRPQRVLDQTGRDGIILLHDIYDATVPQLLAPGKAEPGKVYR
jgi:hypothetical protein